MLLISQNAKCRCFFKSLWYLVHGVFWLAAQNKRKYSGIGQISMERNGLTGKKQKIRKEETRDHRGDEI